MNEINPIIRDMAEFFDFVDLLIEGNLEEKFALFPPNYIDWDKNWGRLEQYDNESDEYPRADWLLHLMNIREAKL